MTRVTITDFRPQIRKLADMVCHHGERVFEDLEALEAMEDIIDLAAAREATKEGNFVELDDLIKELKL